MGELGTTLHQSFSRFPFPYFACTSAGNKVSSRRKGASKAVPVTGHPEYRYVAEGGKAETMQVDRPFEDPQSILQTLKAYSR